MLEDLSAVELEVFFRHFLAKSLSDEQVVPAPRDSMTSDNETV
jgi:hypothetical protein